MQNFEKKNRKTAKEKKRRKRKTVLKVNSFNQVDNIRSKSAVTIGLAIIIHS
jgi:hypothetical protein